MPGLKNNTHSALAKSSFNWYRASRIGRPAAMVWWHRVLRTVDNFVRETALQAGHSFIYERYKAADGKKDSHQYGKGAVAE